MPFAAQVPTVDLAKYGTPEGNAELAQTLIDAIRSKGFFYVVNYGISQDAVDRQFALGQSFYKLPLEEKLKYVPDLENGVYNGYRPAGRRIMGNGQPDKVEVWNMASECCHSAHLFSLLFFFFNKKKEIAPLLTQPRIRQPTTATSPSPSPS